jgi:hypothetical protein
LKVGSLAGRAVHRLPSRRFARTAVTRVEIEVSIGIEPEKYVGKEEK